MNADLMVLDLPSLRTVVDEGTAFELVRMLLRHVPAAIAHARHHDESEGATLLRLPDEAVQRWASLSMADVMEMACEWGRSACPRELTVDACTAALAAAVWLARRSRCTREPLYALLGPEVRSAIGERPRLSQVA
jgi:hypothetical protein